ncbi:Glycoside hydrolase superfamily [Penicillium alfredii]|uniref:Glycoside hydrolase superfamily n=1 Tax=Penicillium alfredii TaxID=1506179 RepID=A0A9W9EM63_9EURO|nr:Glycoside hydrolase superfamily [Penicillium alfredii]KAJ5084402.1 Glycoside hydrolase superfamily [Penicillium alfredii]
MKDLLFSAAGLQSFLQRLGVVVDKAPGALGVYYWEPAWVQNAGLGGSCSDHLLVSWEMDAVRTSLRTLGGL